MSLKENIKHSGIIESIDKQTARVKILVQSACSECHAKGMCNLGDTTEKIVEVNLGGQQFKENDNVIVYTSTGTGLVSILFAYILPVVIVIVTLFVSSALLVEDLLAGLFSIAILFPYFLVLYFFRSSLRQRIQFHIQKTE